MLEELRRRPALLVVSTAVALAAALLAGVLVAAAGDDASDKPEFVLDFEQDDADDAVVEAEGSNPLERGTEAEGDPLPDASFEILGSGKEVSLSDYRGKPLVLNFFGSWCGPCRREMPDLEEVHDELGDEVAFLGLAVRDDEDSASAFVDEMEVTYDTGLDRGDELFSELKILSMPTTFFVSPSGEVVYAHKGEMTAHELRDLIDEHLT